MVGRVTIGDQEIMMSPVASVIRRYRQVFGKDFLAQTQKKDVDSEIFAEMGFIMASAYEKRDMNSLTENDYIEWCDQFSVMDMMNAIPQIAKIWQMSQKQTSTPKKK